MSVSADGVANQSEKFASIGTYGSKVALRPPARPLVASVEDLVRYADVRLLGQCSDINEKDGGDSCACFRPGSRFHGNHAIAD